MNSLVISLVAFCDFKSYHKQIHKFTIQTSIFWQKHFLQVLITTNSCINLDFRWLGCCLVKTYETLKSFCWGGYYVMALLSTPPFQTYQLVSPRIWSKIQKKCNHHLDLYCLHKFIYIHQHPVWMLFKIPQKGCFETYCSCGQITSKQP